MVAALYVIGTIIFFISIVAGILSGSFIGFITALAGGVTTGVIFFALAKIIENQETIMGHLDYKDELERRSRTQEKVTCTKCSYKYDTSYSSCPHCGHKE